MKEIKLSEYAKLKNRCYRTMWNHFHANMLPNAYQDEHGSIYIRLEEEQREEHVVLYSRVSSHDQKFDLERQEQRLCEFANAKGLIIKESIKEIASGLNDNRPKLNKILSSEKVTTIIVENKDRLTRFGFNYLKILLERLNIKLIVINEIENNKNELINDFISVITSFCARIYGQRRCKNNAKKIIKELDVKRD